MITTHIYEMMKIEEFESSADLLFEVKRVGTRLSNADSLNFVVHNTIKRILHIIREKE